MRKGVIIIGIILVVLFTSGCIGETLQTPPTTTLPPQREFKDVTFLEFDRFFGMGGTLTDLQKKAEFEENYFGKYVRWKCQLIDISESLRMQMKCNPGTYTADMFVMLRSDQKNKAVALPKGSWVTYEARLLEYGVLLGHTADDGVIVGFESD